MKKTLTIIITSLLAAALLTAFTFSKDAGNAAHNTQYTLPEAAPLAEPTTARTVDVTQANFTKEDAKATALAHAGVNEADVKHYKVEVDRERNITVYEIEFDAGEYEYDYVINVETGAVVHSEAEREYTAQTITEQNTTVNNAPSANDPIITKEEAKTAALAHAGVSEADVKHYKAEVDKERNVLVYEIEFDAGKFEYEYEVNAENGNVIKHEKERRD